MASFFSKTLQSVDKFRNKFRNTANLPCDNEYLTNISSNAQGPPGGYPAQQATYGNQQPVYNTNYAAPAQGVYGPPPQGNYYPPQQGSGNPPPYGPPPQGGYAQYHQGQQQPVIVVVQQPPPQVMDRKSSIDIFVFNPKFEDPADRKKFIQRVYLILSVDLLYMFGLTFLFSFYPDLNDFLLKKKSNFALIFWPFWTLAIFSMVIRCFCFNLLAQPRWKWLVHIITVVGFGGFAATFAVLYEKEVVLMAVGGTLAIVISITILAFTIPVDFTKCYFAVFLVFILLFIAGISAALLLPNEVIKPVKFGIGIAFVVLFSFWFLLSTQSLMAGKSVTISPDQHVFAATELFLDIWQIFYCLLQVLGFSD